MADVHIAPMPAHVRQTPYRWRSMHPPIFQNGDPTRDDILLALELLGALDEESYEWYSGDRMRDSLRASLNRM